MDWVELSLFNFKAEKRREVGLQRNKEEGGGRGFKQMSFHLLRSSNFC